MSARPYFTLAEFNGEAWFPQFGDYCESVVDAEFLEYVDSGVSADCLVILCTGDSQGEIDAACAALDAKPL